MASTFEQLVQQLRSPDAEQRRAAIMALANTRNPAALEPLADIYRNDPDPDLRELALQAGRYIRQSSGSAAREQSFGTTSSSTGPAESQGQAEARTSDRDEALARRLLDSATNFHLGGDAGRAVENLGKALALKPDLVQETFVENLIMTCTGMSVGQALPMLIHPDQREQLIIKVGGKQKLKKVQTHGDYVGVVSWNRILIDLGVYWIASAISSLVLLVFLLDLIQDYLDDAGYTNTARWFDLDQLLAASLPSLILSSLLNSIGTTFFLVILLLVIHYTAVMFFGGDGAMEVLFRRVVPFLTILSAGLTIILAIFLVIGSATTVWFLVPLVLVGGVAGGFVYMADLVGKVYNFGWVSGCISMVLGWFIFGVLWNCLFYGLSLTF